MCALPRSPGGTVHAHEHASAPDTRSHAHGRIPTPTAARHGRPHSSSCARTPEADGTDGSLRTGTMSIYLLWHADTHTRTHTHTYVNVCVCVYIYALLRRAAHRRFNSTQSEGTNPFAMTADGASESIQVCPDVPYHRRHRLPVRPPPPPPLHVYVVRCSTFSSATFEGKAC